MSLRLDKTIENKLRSLPGNNICVDCDGKNPQWASVSLGIFMCLECSGKHRALGVHISFVRSVTMDSWNDKQIAAMEQGGNNKLNEFLAQYNIPKLTPIPVKYNSAAAKLYKDRLTATIEGKPLPTADIPIETKSAAPTASHAANGHGTTSTEPLQGESEAEYVARQRQLQEEARERLRQKFGASSGLKSGSKMQGIGSDPHYNPNGTTDEFNIAEVSNKALSYVSTGLSLLGEQVNKAKSTYLDGSASNGSSGGVEVGDALQKGWSVATSFWQQASMVTLDAVSKISLNADGTEDARFPRTAGELGGKNAHIASSYVSSTTYSSSSSASASANTNSDSHKGHVRSSSSSSLKPPSSTTASSGSSLHASHSMSSLQSSTTSISPRPMSNSTPNVSSGLRKTNSMTMDSPAGATTPTTNRSSNKQSATATAPVGDDFFSNFGV